MRLDGSSSPSVRGGFRSLLGRLRLEESTRACESVEETLMGDMKASRSLSYSLRPKTTSGDFVGAGVGGAGVVDVGVVGAADGAGADGGAVAVVAAHSKTAR